MTLDELKIGQSAVIKSVGGEGTLRQHFLDMGVIPGARTTLIKFAPMGDPMELRVHGYELTLRLDDAKNIEIGDVLDEGEEENRETSEGCIKEEEQASETSEKQGLDKKDSGKKEKHGDKKPSKRDNDIKKVKYNEHPGFGEEGKYHKKNDGKKLPDGTLLTFALAGNQNSGKTTLFNQLTGSNQHVGNFPGVTVDRKSGSIKNHPNTEVVDLPGIYSLSPYTEEEIVSRQYIIGEKPKGIINIVDATNIERNLYLTMQLIELDIPMVLALNMMDEVRGNGGSVRINDMEKLLGIPVVPISAAKNEGVNEVISHALHVAKYQESPGKKDFCDKNDHNGAVHRCVHSIMHLIEDHAVAADIPLRFAANKVIEGDSRVIDALKLTQNEKETVEHIIIQMEEERGLDRAAAMADMRFSFIEKLVSCTVIKPEESKERERSEKMDKILTGKHTAIPAFAIIMSLIFYLTFNLIGAFFQEKLEYIIGVGTDNLEKGLVNMSVNKVLISLVIDGICNGIGIVLSFLPIIIILFFFLSLLEDSGYMARIAFVMDKPLRKIGLSGRSIVPMLIGFGCSVPGVMASRTLPSQRDRKLTILMIPFMSCTAKLPIYGFFAATFFPGHGALVMIVLYLFGIFMGILTALVSKRTVFKGEAVPFVMELPNYRMPSAKNVFQLLWEKAKDFITRAFTVIFLASIVVWFMQKFSLQFEYTENVNESILYHIAKFIAPLFKPLGFGDWRVAVALITGFMAKESVVSTLQVLYGSSKSSLLTIGNAAAVSLLVFCLLYTPCVAAIASVKRELGKKWAAIMVILQCSIAWVSACVIYNIACMIL